MRAPCGSRCRDGSGCTSTEALRSRAPRRFRRRMPRSGRYPRAMTSPGRLAGAALAALLIAEPLACADDSPQIAPAGAEALREQMDEDITPIPAGMGALLVPSLTRPDQEPVVVVLHAGRRVASGPTGRRAVARPNGVPHAPSGHVRDLHRAARGHAGPLSSARRRARGSARRSLRDGAYLGRCARARRGAPGDGGPGDGDPAPRLSPRSDTCAGTGTAPLRRRRRPRDRLFREGDTPFDAPPGAPRLSPRFHGAPASDPRDLRPPIPVARPLLKGRGHRASRRRPLAGR